MTMGIMPGPGLSYGGSGAWTPAQLFTGGFDGVWFDPSDFSTLFQDTGGTIPVTAAGQSVALMKDKSGNGHDASQATSASRPTIQQDGSGNWYLSFSGSNYMTCGTGFNATTVAMCLGFQGSAANERLIDSRGTGTIGTVIGQQLKVGDASGDDGFAVDSGATNYVTSNHTVSFSVNHCGYFDFTSGNNFCRYQIDAGSLTNGPTKTTVSNSTSTATSTMGGASNSPTTQTLIGRIYPFALVKARSMTTTDINNFRAYVGGKCGVAV